MCGVVGVIGAALDVQKELDRVATMRDTMTHRGPDGEGLWHSAHGSAVFGHRRLSIVDLTDAGRQPMSNETGTVWITYNGEIYNHSELRRGLEARGHHYASCTDTETIVHLYEEAGIECVHQLLGMFAFGIWDDDRERLFLARDRLGVKPLYYTVANGKFLFASEVKALLAHPDIEVDLDEQALSHYLTFLVTPAPATLFKGIKKLPAGHRAVVDLYGNVCVERWWDAIVPERNDADEADNIDQLRALLRDSIDKRMMSDVPFGVLLSGGVDSSTNVALMAELMDRPVDTFSVGFSDDDRLNELHHARFVAERFATNHHEVVIGKKELLEFLPDLAFYQDEPIADPVCVPLHYVSKLAKQSGTTVVQVGEGADEIFCGYSSYMRHLKLSRAWQRASALPQPLVRGVGNIAARVLNQTSHKDRAEYARRLGGGAELFLGGAIAFLQTDKQSLIPGVASRTTQSYSIVEEFYREFDMRRPGADALERMTYLELKQRLPELLLMRVDKMSMANSVESRVPFLDHRLVEFALSLSVGQKTHGGMPKYLLKKAVEGILPDKVIYRTKQGFGAPISAWFRDDLGEILLSSLHLSGLAERDIFDLDVVRGMLDRHRAGHEENSFKLWILLNLSLWYGRWITEMSPLW